LITQIAHTEPVEAADKESTPGLIDAAEQKPNEQQIPSNLKSSIRLNSICSNCLDENPSNNRKKTVTFSKSTQDLSINFSRISTQDDKTEEPPVLVEADDPLLTLLRESSSAKTIEIVDQIDQANESEAILRTQEALLTCPFKTGRLLNVIKNQYKLGINPKKHAKDLLTKSKPLNLDLRVLPSKIESYHFKKAARHLGQVVDKILKAKRRRQKELNNFRKLLVLGSL